MPLRRLVPYKPAPGEEITLRTYLEARIDGVNAEMLIRFRSLHAANAKYERALDIRLEHMNEYRSQLAAQRSQFATNERLDDAVQANHTLYDNLQAATATAAESVRRYAERDSASLRERLDRTSKETEDRMATFDRALGTFVRTEKLDLLLGEMRATAEARVKVYDRDGKDRDEAINTLRTQYAALWGRISGMGIVVVLVSIALQVVLFLIQHR